MSAMSRLATELYLIGTGEINATQQFHDTLVKLGYEPAEHITELDVIDAEKNAALAWVRCQECDYSDVAVDMVVQSDGEYLCPGCDYGYIIEARQQQYALARVGRY